MASAEEFPEFTDNPGMIPSESHNTVPLARESDDLPVIAMHSACHDTRKRDLPEGSFRTLNLGLYIRCSAGLVVAIQKNVLLEQPVMVDGHVQTHSDKGTCVPDETQRLLRNQKRKESWHRKRNRDRAASIAAAAAQASDVAESSQAAKRRQTRGRNMCYDLSAAAVPDTIYIELPRAIMLMASIEVPIRPEPRVFQIDDPPLWYKDMNHKHPPP